MKKSSNDPVFNDTSKVQHKNQFRIDMLDNIQKKTKRLWPIGQLGFINKELELRSTHAVDTSLVC